MTISEEYLWESGCFLRGLNLFYSACSLCKPLDKDSFNDVATFASDLSGNFAGVVQYNKDNRAFEVKWLVLGLQSSQHLCEQLTRRMVNNYSLSPGTFVTNTGTMTPYVNVY